MKLPDPSGFARTSPTARICEHVEDACKGQSARMAPPLDLRRLFDLPHERFPRRPAPPPALPVSAFRPRWDAAEDTLIQFFPKVVNGQVVMRRTKSGEMKPEQIRVEIAICAVTVTVERGSFVLTATSRGNNVHDSRDDSRKPLSLHRADLRRLFPTEHEAIAARLSSVLPGPRAGKPRPLNPLCAEERARVEMLTAARDKAENEARANRRKPAAESEPKPDFAAMTGEEFTSFNAARRAEGETAIRWIYLDSALASDRLEIAAPRVFPAPFAA